MNILKELRLYLICLIVVALITAAITWVGFVFFDGISSGNGWLILSSVSIIAVLALVLYLKASERV